MPASSSSLRGAGPLHVAQESDAHLDQQKDCRHEERQEEQDHDQRSHSEHERTEEVPGEGEELGRDTAAAVPEGIAPLVVEKCIPAWL